ncbi:glycoside hydrolase family 2 TIM barrel-domain containing protein [Pontimicrobium sp. SW4]|uniref:Glycoside hydrolase family 2 TIM barrel-domain containing protein n=1 Tax=Pontimicrobium sp. SW4 TaxID=3153519 RepID=A0AAU7BT43_9FLAO
MVSFSRNIIRFILIASYVIIIALIISGISVLFGYLNTGADRSTMLNTEVKRIEQYLPKIEWSSLTNEGRPMDSENLKNIENDYLNAWYIQHIAFNTNSTKGINDYYTDNARINLFNLIELNKTEGVYIESTTLEHHPNLEFFSEDGQLAVITDKDVIEYKRVFKNNTLVLETTEVSTYKIILLLEDDFWRIRHKIKIETKDLKNTNNNIITSNNLNIKGINYYPQTTPWDMFGNAFSKDTIIKDFKIIKNSGLNTVRIFVQYEDFGKAKINQDKIDKLIQVLDAAEANNLGVIVTLFDFYGDYSVINYTLNMRHAETIISSLKNHDALIAWDVKNEPNLDFKSRGQKKVIAWLDNIITLIKATDKAHPVTIGWSNPESAIILSDKVDFVSFHYYEDLDDLDASIETLQLDIPNKSIVMGEFGLSSYNGLWNPFGSSEEDQANYHKRAQKIIAEHNLQYVSWTLYDFVNIPKEVVGKLPWKKNVQKQFGFINKKGEKKSAFKYITTQQ